MATAVGLARVKWGPEVACCSLGGARPKQRNTGVFVLREHKILGLKGGSKAPQPRVSWFGAVAGDSGGRAALELQRNPKTLG